MAFVIKLLLFLLLPMYCWYHSVWLSRLGWDDSFKRLAIGIGGPFYSLLFLNLGLVLIPKQAEWVYLGLFFIPVVLSWPEFKVPKLNLNLSLKWSEWLFGSAILGMMALWVMLTFFKPLTEHDTMEYLAQGNVFARDLQITYDEVRYDEQTGFYFVGLHAFGYPLVRTIDLLGVSLLGDSGFYFFKSISGLYGVFLVLLLYGGLKKEKLPYPEISAMTLAATYGFLFTYLQFGLDNIRFCFHFISFYFMYRALRDRTNSDALFMSIFIGLGAYIHSIGLILGIIQLMVVFLFVNSGILERMKKGFQQSLMVIFFGAWHYIVDTFFGTGWIF